MYSLLIASSAETSFQIKTAYLFYCFFTKCLYDFLVFVFHLVQDYIANSPVHKQGSVTYLP